METIVVIPGYFMESQAKALVAALEGKTYMNFHVVYSNWAGNCSLQVSTTYETDKKELMEFFMHYALSALAQAVR